MTKVAIGINQKRKDVKDNFQTDRAFLVSIIDETIGGPTPTPREKHMARIIKRLLRQVHEFVGGIE